MRLTGWRQNAYRSKQLTEAKEATWAWLGGVDFEEEDQNTDQMGHIASKSEDIHGSRDRKATAFARFLEREKERESNVVEERIQAEGRYRTETEWKKFWLFCFLCFALIRLGRKRRWRGGRER